MNVAKPLEVCLFLSLFFSFIDKGDTFPIIIPFVHLGTNHKLINKILLKVNYKYYEANNILYLQSQDNDLNYLDKFSNVEYVSLPQEAYNFDNLNGLRKLKGAKCIFK